MRINVFPIVFSCLLCVMTVWAQQPTVDTKQISGQVAEQIAERLQRQLPQNLLQLSLKQAVQEPKPQRGILAILTPKRYFDERRFLEAALQPVEPAGPIVQDPAPSQPVQTPPNDTPNIRLPTDRPLGAAGRSRDNRKPTIEDAEFMIVRDRWRVGIPEDPRFGKSRSIINPFRQNVLKGDYPIIGNDKFVNISLISETTFELRRVPVPQDISSRNPGGFEFFGRGRQDSISTNFVMSIDFFKGDASFKPVDWRFKVTGIANVNYLSARENGIVNFDVREGTSRQKNFTSIEEVFFEYRLGDTQKVFPFLRGAGSKGGRSPEFDTTSIRVGLQAFTSDFRGFIFSDTNLGVRLFGNFGSNRWQYNLAYFNMLDKDTNSGLNVINFSNTTLRNQQVYVANLFRQDTFVLGYTTQFSIHYSDDNPIEQFKYDNNNFLVRPALIGTIRPHRVRSGYFGWTGDGHFGRYNITHALYQAIGRDSFNQIAGRGTKINAQMAAGEFSIDFDYIRYRVSAFYTSGDSNPTDGTARGFDAILDSPNFAGGRFSFFNSQGLRLINSSTALVEPRSLIPSLRSSKIQGQANFVNPGLSLYNAGIDVDVTPKLRSFINYNYLRFNHTDVIEQVSLFRAGVRHEIGHDVGVGFIYRPMLNENIVFTGGATGLRVGRGLTDIFTSNCNGSTTQGCGARRPTLWSTFVTMKLAY